jgi:hypothetical protein
MSRTAKTTIREFDEQTLSIRSIEILSELLQVRATLDKAWSLQYSRGYANGDPFPPVLVFRLPDGRHVLVDGYHRIDACIAIGLKTIRVQIRDGTMQEALLAAIEANTAEFHRGRPFGKDDRTHAVELMFANPACWLWADQRISDHVGLTGNTVAKRRREYSIRMGLPLPERVLTIEGRSKPYLTAAATGVPTISRGSHQSKRVWIGGKQVVLPNDPAKAEDKVKAILNERSEKRRALTMDAIATFLLNYGFLTDPCGVQYSCPGVVGRKGNGFIFTASLLKDNAQAVPLAVGSLMMLREHKGKPTDRLIAVCYAEDGPAASIEVARGLGVEFLTPDELVASLAPEPPL